MNSWAKRARSLHYSCSAPQLSSTTTSTARTVRYPSTASSFCGLRLSDVEDSDPHGETSPPPSAATDIALPERSPRPRANDRHVGSLKQDEEPFLARVEVNRAASPLHRDIVSDVSVPKVVCVSIFTVACCVVGMQLVVHKVSGLREDATDTGSDEGNTTEAVLDLQHSKDHELGIVVRAYKILEGTENETRLKGKWITTLPSPVPTNDRDRKEERKGLEIAASDKATGLTYGVQFGPSAPLLIQKGTPSSQVPSTADATFDILGHFSHPEKHRQPAKEQTAPRFLHSKVTPDRNSSLTKHHWGSTLRANISMIKNSGRLPSRRRHTTVFAVAEKNNSASLSTLSSTVSAENSGYDSANSFHESSPQATRKVSVLDDARYNVTQAAAIAAEGRRRAVALALKALKYSD
ncbi:hypothetical protein V5799_027860 [Amblyomma americanum]|uniref:Uncharacterized protein n=1 Tax=Amblyomma americanum TaxID=6943 RepID=A0AAQ4DEI2_AMBAM